MLRRSARILKRPVENEGLPEVSMSSNHLLFEVSANFTQTRRVRPRGPAPGPGLVQENYEKRTVSWLVRHARVRVIIKALEGNLRKADMIARIRQFDTEEAELTKQREEIRLQEAEAGDIPTPVIPSFVERAAKLVPQISGEDLLNNLEWYQPYDSHASTQDRDTWWRMEKRIGLGAFGYVSFWVKLDHEGTLVDVSSSSSINGNGNTDRRRESY